ncbi:MAG: flippase-like domain-containing protein [Actinobacteria bacterium]|nr:flippase-like domain-containing protein [Actinomycetota bacterium]
MRRGGHEPILPRPTESAAKITRDATPAPPVPAVKRKLIVLAVAAAVVGAVFAFVLPKIADYGDVWGTLRGLTWAQLGVLALAVVANVVTFAPPFVATLPGLGFMRALTLTQASTASTYLAPGGAAVGVALAFAMLRGWGFEKGAVALSVALTGIWNQLFLLGAPAVGLALLTTVGGHNALLQTVSLIGLIAFVGAAGIFATALSADRPARWAGARAAELVNWVLARFHRGPVGWGGESLVRFRGSAIRLLRRRWLALTLATLAGQLTVFALLFVCLRTLEVTGGEVAVVEAFAAWTLVRLLGSLPMTPGGLGVVELGLTGALIGFGGNNAGVVAAVLLYRVLTILPTLALGLVAGATWRRQRRDAPLSEPA